MNRTAEVLFLAVRCPETNQVVNVSWSEFLENHWHHVTFDHQVETEESSFRCPGCGKFHDVKL